MLVSVSVSVPVPVSVSVSVLAPVPVSMSEPVPVSVSVPVPVPISELRRTGHPADRVCPPTDGRSRAEQVCNTGRSVTSATPSQPAVLCVPL